MKKTQIISMVAALLLAQSFALSGCGGGGSSEGASSSDPAAANGSGASSSTMSSAASSSDAASGGNGNASSDADSVSGVAVPVTVRVATLYPVVDATVVADDKQALVVGDGTYEFSRSVDGALGIVAKGGVVDLNGNGLPDHGEPYAPEFRASSGSEVLNPFTTLLANGMSSDAIIEAYPTMAPYAPNFAIASFSVETAQDALKATIRLSIEQYDSEGVLDQAQIDADIKAAINYEDLNLIYQTAMFKINRLYTDASMCLPLSPCVYPGITPSLDVDYTYGGAQSSASSESSSSSSSSSEASSSSASSTGTGGGGSVTPPSPN